MCIFLFGNPVAYIHIYIYICDRSYNTSQNITYISTFQSTKGSFNLSQNIKSKGSQTKYDVQFEPYISLSYGIYVCVLAVYPISDVNFMSEKIQRKLNGFIKEGYSPNSINIYTSLIRASTCSCFVFL